MIKEEVMDLAHSDIGPCLYKYEYNRSYSCAAMRAYHVCLQKEQKLNPQSAQLRNRSHPDEAPGSALGLGTGAWHVGIGQCIIVGSITFHLLRTQGLRSPLAQQSLR